MNNLFMEMGSAANWITPGIAFLQDIMNGPAAHFGVPALSDWGKRDIKRLLKRWGIQVWGLMYTLDMDTLMFSVPEAKAQLAYDVLNENDVPLSDVPGIVIRQERKGLFG